MTWGLGKEYSPSRTLGNRKRLERLALKAYQKIPDRAVYDYLYSTGRYDVEPLDERHDDIEDEWEAFVQGAPLSVLAEIVDRYG